MSGRFDDLYKNNRQGTTTFESYFYSLVKPPERAKPMKCLRCNRVHKTTKNKHICSQCKGTGGKTGGSTNGLKVGARAFYSYPDRLFTGGK